MCTDFFEPVSQYKCLTWWEPQHSHKRKKNRSFDDPVYPVSVTLTSSASEVCKKLFIGLSILKGLRGIHKWQIHACTSFTFYAKLDLCSNLFYCGWGRQNFFLKCYCLNFQFQIQLQVFLVELYHLLIFLLNLRRWRAGKDEKQKTKNSLELTKEWIAKQQWIAK